MRTRGATGAKPRRHVTMKEVAAAAEVSQSTVSRILSGAPLAVPVSAETRERVLAAAQRLHYRPNPLARALRGARTMLVGAIVRDITDPFFAGAIDALSVAARGAGYSVVLGHARGQADEALALAAVLEARQCDAIVLLGDVREHPQLVADLGSVDTPVVALWQGSGETGFPAIAVDNRAAMRAVDDHLRGLGHERVAVAGDTANADVRERADAFGDDVPVVVVQNTAAGGAQALDELLASPTPPTAIAAATDVIAFGVLHRAAALGIAVPGELSVTGFDDIPLSATAVPGLTTVAMPVAEMTTAALALALGTDPAPARHTFPASLVVRASTGPV